MEGIANWSILVINGKLCGTMCMAKCTMLQMIDREKKSARRCPMMRVTRRYVRWRWYGALQGDITCSFSR
jgi:hypothetical protein